MVPRSSIPGKLLRFNVKTHRQRSFVPGTLILYSLTYGQYLFSFAMRLASPVSQLTKVCGHRTGVSMNWDEESVRRTSAHPVSSVPIMHPSYYGGP